MLKFDSKILWFITTAQEDVEPNKEQSEVESEITIAKASQGEELPMDK